eukprot:g24548.t1
MVLEAIQSRFAIPEEEQHLLQDSSEPNVDFYRVERKMDPRKLRFTQERISPTFRDGRQIYQLLNDLNQQLQTPDVDGGLARLCRPAMPVGGLRACGGQKMRLRDLSSATVPCPEMRGRGWCITSAIEKKKNPVLSMPGVKPD